MSRIAITTTVPVEIVYAAGLVPVDLNNIFITDQAPLRLVEQAEDAGYPRNICGWIKGLYSSVLNSDGDIEKVIAVTQGDCSNTQALMETLEMSGIATVPFAYPYDRDYDMLKLQMEKLMKALGTDWSAVQTAKKWLDGIRRKVAELDRLTWQENVVSGFHNHIYQVSCSDFNSDPVAFEADVDNFLTAARQNCESSEDIRLAYIGVPPIVPELYGYLETIGARVVFNEVQRQFAMPYELDDIVEQYRRYTYPYGAFARMEDIAVELERRNIDGIIHYVQSFCFRQIEDMIFREKLGVPVLTVEGDKPGKLDARTKLRLDSFVEMLR